MTDVTIAGGGTLARPERSGNMIDRNPKTNPDPGSNTVKDPDMTGAQASYLKTLSEQTGATFEEGLTKAEASKRIDALRDKAGLPSR